MEVDVYVPLVVLISNVFLFLENLVHLGMEMTNDFAVVKFPDERDKIEIVPYVWVRKNTEDEMRSKCLWPHNVDSKLLKELIDDEMEPDENWTPHRCKIATRGSRKYCEMYFKKYAATSDVGTDAEEEFRRKSNKEKHNSAG